MKQTEIIEKLQKLLDDNESLINGDKVYADLDIWSEAKVALNQLKNHSVLHHVSECVLYSDGTNMQYKGDSDLTIVLDGEFKAISLKQLGKGKITIDTRSDKSQMSKSNIELLEWKQKVIKERYIK